MRVWQEVSYSVLYLGVGPWDLLFKADTQPPQCLLDRVARVRRRLSTAWFSTVCRVAVASLKIARSGNFPYATLQGGCLCYSSLLSGYASEVTVMHWIGRRATGINEHVRYTVPFLIGAVSLAFIFILLVWSHRRVWKGLLWGDRRINLAAYSRDDWSLIWICSRWLEDKLDLLCVAVFCRFEEVPLHGTPLWAISSEYSWFPFDPKENRC